MVERNYGFKLATFAVRAVGQSTGYCVPIVGKCEKFN